jgi:hypothetical protein
MAQIHDADAQISKGVMIQIAGSSLASVAADSRGGGRPSDSSMTTLSSSDNNITLQAKEY